MLHPGPASRLQHLDRAGHVDLMGPHRIPERPGHRRHCREVHDRPGAFEGTVQDARVKNGPLLELDPGTCEVRLEPGRQVVDGDDLVNLGAAEQRPAQVGTDEPGAPGDDDLHAAPSSTTGW